MVFISNHGQGLKKIQRTKIPIKLASLKDIAHNKMISKYLKKRARWKMKRVTMVNQT